MNFMFIFINKHLKIERVVGHTGKTASRQLKLAIMSIYGERSSDYNNDIINMFKQLLKLCEKFPTYYVLCNRPDLYNGLDYDDTGFVWIDNGAVEENEPFSAKPDRSRTLNECVTQTCVIPACNYESTIFGTRATLPTAPAPAPASAPMPPLPIPATLNSFDKIEMLNIPVLTPFNPYVDDPPIVPPIVPSIVPAPTNSKYKVLYTYKGEDMMIDTFEKASILYTKLVIDGSSDADDILRVAKIFIQQL